MTEKYNPSKDTILIISKARDRKVVEFTIELAEWLIFTPRFGKEHPFTVYVDAHLDTPKLFQRLTHPAWQTYLKFWTPKLCYRQPDLFHLIITVSLQITIYVSYLSLNSWVATERFCSLQPYFSLMYHPLCPFIWVLLAFWHPSCLPHTAKNLITCLKKDFQRHDECD
ncbi:hypothetical protein RMCBS344292_00001 [Rhizopus microsporus]|nr:hypothetical protein RMCBS344292_00001 [Rhizopus microsporus]